MKYTIFWRKNLLGKLSLGTPKSKWEDNIKMYLTEIGYVRTRKVFNSGLWC
jgi:hypothetical protein